MRNTRSSSRLSLINKLPCELLAYIFVCALPDVRNADDVGAPSVREAPLNVSRVCRSWRSLALSTRQLWSRVYFNINHYHGRRRLRAAMDAVEAFVDRSAPYPLVIHVNGMLPSRFERNAGKRWRDRHFMEEWMKFGTVLSKKLLQIQTRWRLVKLQLPSMVWLPGDEEEDEKWILNKCDSIEELWLELHPNWHIDWLDYVRHPLILPLLNWTRMRRLRLSGFTFQLARNADSEPTTTTAPAQQNLSSLRSIRIKQFGFHRNEPLQLLSLAPYLEELHLDISRMDMALIGEAWHGGSDSLLCYSHLRKMQITLPRLDRNPTGGELLTMLNRMTAPALEYLNISNRYGSHADIKPLLESVARLLQRSRASLVVLLIRAHPIPCDALTRLLVLSPRLEHFGLLTNCGQPDPLFQPLVVSPTSSEETILCPRLHTLTIQVMSDGQNFCNAVSQLLQSRSPPDSERYAHINVEQTPTSPGPNTAVPLSQIARFGTAVLQTVRLVYCYAFEENEALVNPSVSEKSRMWKYDHDVDMVAMVDRGLKLVKNAKWESGYSSRYASEG